MEIIDIIELTLAIAVPVFFLGLGYFAGQWTASRHEADMQARQPAVAHIWVHDMRPLNVTTGQNPPIMITSEVTLGIDHFRGFLGQLKSLIGGQVASYQNVLDRARREVTLRLQEQAARYGYTAIANFRIDFVDISGTSTIKRKASFVSILATGTAYYHAP